jgi:hypothetical protein
MAKKAAKKARKRTVKRKSTTHSTKHKVRAKKLPKKPKKPKAKASLATWERFDQRMKDWHHKVAQLHKDAQHKHNLISKYSRC